MKQKKLMILGASSAQLPIIHKAIELECHVITVDNLPGNIGHQFAQQSVNCSTVNQYGVLLYAQELEIDGIVTFASDVATTTVAYVAEQMGLTGCPTKVIAGMSNKANFRLFQQQHNLNHPAFYIANSINDIRLDRTLAVPLLCKPVDTSGSRGVTSVESLTLQDLGKAFSYAQCFSRSGLVSVEEFVLGIDVSGDGFLIDGELCMLITQKYMQGFVPIGHSLPCNLAPGEQQRIREEVEHTCRALGYRNGPIDFDVKLDDHRVVVIEMGARLGGNGIPELIRRATGIDFIAMTIQYALGEQCVLPVDASVINPCASWVFGSESKGRLENIASDKKLRREVPELFEYTMNYKIGDDVPFFEHSGNCLGYALFDCPPSTGYQTMVNKLNIAMQLQVLVSQ